MKTFISEQLLKMSKLVERVSESLQKTNNILKDHEERLERLEMYTFETFVLNLPKDELDLVANTLNNSAAIRSAIAIVKAFESELADQKVSSESGLSHANDDTNPADSSEDDTLPSTVRDLICWDCGKVQPLRYTDETERAVRIEEFTDWSFSAEHGWRCPDCTVGHERAELNLP